ncbi:endonuclease/exonuclease/phosphatase family protein [Shewanella sp. NFH-SH190041]|uniref:endonuclease/exonuclease/phosphatase family protein n=1 Tax=Shewanella sp. NFH-SH190041 TaxID=2950245 RepID=UPI0021C4AB60|nr:endonuclease/exonuclease/phosphatase family protein [Shewanella sp. NFH-SH190041]
MTLIKTAAAAAISLALLSGCNDETTNHYYPVDPAPETQADHVRIGAYNLSFDRQTFAQLAAEMALPKSEQDRLVKGYVNGDLSDADKAVALKVIQIRNVAAIIQHQRPAILMMSEFNNDGTGQDLTALTDFKANYLAIAQSLNSIDGGELQKPIHFPHMASFATNTGLASGMDLDNDGKTDGPGDAWGFGQYHGQYAFGLLSRYPINHEKIRTFQQFKWKDMPGATNVAVNCKEGNTAAWCAEPFWYSDAEWAALPLSSKNHVDVPVTVSLQDKEQTIHLLMSHPTPPVFDKGDEAPYNVAKNAAEIGFWVDYIAGKDYMTDDAGGKGGLAPDSQFVVMGDLNADPENGDGDLTTINALLRHNNVNHLVTTGSFAPSSNGAEECLANGDCKQSLADTPYPRLITSTFGLRVDHVVPSAGLHTIDAGVFWPASNEAGYLLMNDKRVGKYGNGKDISSDHRMVWIDIEL